MSKKKQQNKEEETRKRIRLELEKAHDSAEENSSNFLQHSVDEDVDLQLGLIKRYIQGQIEEEIYSDFPEFIKCENYLNEIRWLTPLELEADFEFFPTSESKFSRFIKKFKKEPSGRLADSPVYDDLKQELKQSIESDAINRINTFKNEVTNRKEEKSTISKSKIYQEEMDRFYGAKSGYNKYRNHIGEEKWMTLEELNNQEEYYEAVIPAKRKLLKWLLIGIAVISAGIVTFKVIDNLNHHELSVGFVVVEFPENNGNLYVNHKLAVGFRMNRPYQLPTGNHELSILGSGFVSDPKSKMVTIVSGDTAIVRFRLIEKDAIKGALVVIKAAYPEAAIFVNGEFNGPLGEQDPLILPEGTHSIILKKDGFITSPAQHVLKVVAGDTVNIAFQMMRESRTKGRQKDQQRSGRGLIEVRSDVKNADIYLNGRKTDYKTDYVLQRVPYGEHIIQVSKPGYQVLPDKQIVKLNNSQKRAIANFDLKSTSRQIKIQTLPVPGTILLDGKKMGFGSFTGRLSLGKHEIAFGDVEYYNNPGKQIVEITHTSPEKLDFIYQRNFHLEFSPHGVLPAHSSANINWGHMLNKTTFRRGEDAGPEVRSAGIFDKVWWMGYAFEYRNPRGVDALQFSFKLPDIIDLSTPVYLKVYGYRTDSDYPLVLSGDCSYRIIVNNTKLKSNIRPSASIEQANKDRYDQFIINHLLQKGYNRIMIANMEDASAFMALWKIIIE